MALKSKEWFYKQCLAQVDGIKPLAHLSWSVLKKGVGQEDYTRGHVNQAIGAVQGFLEDYPQHIRTIKRSDPTTPFDIQNHAEILHEWLRWFATKHDRYGRTDFGFNYDTLRGFLPRNLGGTRGGGGGGGDELSASSDLWRSLCEPSNRIESALFDGNDAENEAERHRASGDIPA